MTCVGVVVSRIAGAEDLSPPVTALTTTKDGRHLLECSQLGIRLRNWADFHVSKSITPPIPQLHDVSLSADESVLFACGGEPGVFDASGLAVDDQHAASIAALGWARGDQFLGQLVLRLEAAGNVSPASVDTRMPWPLTLA